MGAFTRFTAEQFLREQFQAAPHEPVGSLYMGLFTTLPDENGFSGVEVVGNGYARLAVGPEQWEVAGRQISNRSEIRFDPAIGSWGDITGLGLWDQAGMLRFMGPAETVISITKGDRYIIEPGAFVLRVGG